MTMLNLYLYLNRTLLILCSNCSAIRDIQLLHKNHLNDCLPSFLAASPSKSAISGTESSFLALQTFIAVKDQNRILWRTIHP